MKINLHTSASLQYKLQVLRKGEIVIDRPFRDYMITDAGLNTIGAGSNWCAQIGNAILGTAVSPTPVRRDSGATTFTQSTTTLTASVAFFSAADVGRLFKYGTGSGGAEMYITAFTSSTVVTVSVSTTVGTPTIGTIWYVNTAALGTPIAGLTWSKDPGALNNFNNVSTLGAVCTVMSQCTIISTALASNSTITEIAINVNTTNTNVFDRDLVSPPVALLTGDQARVIVQLTRNYSPITSTAAGNVGVGCNTAGDMQIETIMIQQNGVGISSFDSNGNVGGGGGFPMDPAAAAGQINIVTGGAITFQAFNSTAGTARTATAKNLTPASYGTGNFYRDSTCTASISQAVGTIYGVGLSNTGISDGSSGSVGCNVIWKFTTPFAKSGTQTLKVDFRRSWSRILTN